jgi:hypothetical protein
MLEGGTPVGSLEQQGFIRTHLEQHLMRDSSLPNYVSVTMYHTLNTIRHLIEQNMERKEENLRRR